jgi:hypothetical protein
MPFGLFRRSFTPTAGSLALPRNGRRTLFRLEQGPRRDPQSHSVAKWIYTQLDGWQRVGIVALVWCDGFSDAAVRETRRRLARRAEQLEASAEAERGHDHRLTVVPPPAAGDDHGRLAA